MEGYILTQTPLNDLQQGDTLTWADLARRYHVYHQDDAGAYVHTLMSGP